MLLSMLQDDIGLSSVVGSAIFNIMFVISLCALFAGSVSVCPFQSSLQVMKNNRIRLTLQKLLFLVSLILVVDYVIDFNIIKDITVNYVKLFSASSMHSLINIVLLHLCLVYVDSHSHLRAFTFHCL